MQPFLQGAFSLLPININQITDKKQVELDIVLVEGYGEENEFR